jgi:hypothetical protein
MRYPLSRCSALALGWVSIALATPAFGQSTMQYGYDELGRLITVNIAGGTNDQKSVTTSFDPAGNRTSSVVTTPSQTPTPTPTPTPGPTPTPTPMPSPTLSIDSTRSGPEGRTLGIYVHLIGLSSSTVSVNYATANNTATAGSDYTAQSGTLYFPPGTTTQLINVPLLLDLPPESTESFYVNLSSPVGAALSNSQSLAFITETSTTLLPPATLYGDQSLYSEDGRFKLIMQLDGNLVLYIGSSPLWSSNTPNNVGAYMSFQSDGNLVVYRANGTPAWASGTDGHSDERLLIQNDGNMVLYRDVYTPSWSSGSCCH